MPSRWRGRLAEAGRRLGVDRACLLLGGIALIVFAIGSTWGIPQATSAIMDRGWDVDGIAGMNVLAELHNLLIQPKADWYTAYPLFHYLLLGALYAPYLLALKLTGGFGIPSESFPYGFEDPVTAIATLTIIARAVTVMMGAGIVMGAYLIAKSLWDETAATWAALVVLLSGPIVFYARTSNLDVPVLFWTTVGLLVAVRSLTLGFTRRRAILLGVAVGLAVATKDQSYGAWLFGLAFVAATAMWPRGRDRAAPTRDRAWGFVVALGVTSLVVYALANGIPFRPSRFISHVQFVTGFERSFFNVQHPSMLTVLRPPTVSGYLLLLGDLLRAVSIAIGPLFLLLGGLGLILAWRATPASRILAWSGLGFVLLSLIPIRHMQYRYAMLPGFVCALFAGYAVMRATHHSARLKAVAFGVMVLGLGWQLVKAADLTYQMVFDARYKAGEWLAVVARPGDDVAYFGISHKLPMMPAGVQPVELTQNATARNQLAAREFRFVIVAADYFSDVERERSLFLPESIYDDLRNGALGYRRAAIFVTSPLLGRPLPYLPYVNPTVQFFEAASPNAIGE